uniref:PREDICTED: similar to predicted protein putative n=1 Tax=Albugo laibachii Nc14 TaxID=890382 RepID=F0WW41_9STRA|nr:PREDICTED: similar to predicted protein putative [Albugo laibachii Nc14]|eukprot:CCA25649.1 PREDICTED: similar to predicted protein putative [Albugo laibachii Nc14]
MSGILLASLRYKRVVILGSHSNTILNARACMSSMNGNNSQSTKRSVFQKLARWMEPFVQGTKALYQENLQAWHIRNRIKQSQGVNNNNKPLIHSDISRKEMMIVRQAHRDLFKSLPLLVLFTVPLIGYAAPILGFKFPKQLLPWQFWSDGQKTQFFQENALERADHHSKLIQIVRPILSKSDSTGKKTTLALVNNKSPSIPPIDMHKIAPYFEESGLLSLKRLNDDHLALLTQLHASNPGLSFLFTYLPKEYLVRHLSRRVEEIRVDDFMLMKEGTKDLSLSELEFACSDRGIVSGYGKTEDMRGALDHWLSMYSKDSKDEVVRYPTSLLCHAPALMKPKHLNDSQK